MSVWAESSEGAVVAMGDTQPDPAPGCKRRKDSLAGYSCIRLGFTFSWYKWDESDSPGYLGLSGSTDTNRYERRFHLRLSSYRSALLGMVAVLGAAVLAAVPAQAAT